MSITSTSIAFNLWGLQAAQQFCNCLLYTSPFLRWCFVATALTLAGCSNTSWRKSEVLAVPLQPTLQQEVILARMEQILASRALTDDERAQLLYERGVLYDRCLLYTSEIDVRVQIDRKSGDFDTFRRWLVVDSCV